MLKIGDFSRLARVSVKTLRLYDEMGLIRPVWVDRYSGYRYYRLDQLPRLNRILALKDLGFSLQQVRELLSSDLPPERLRQMFDEQQTSLQKRLLAEQTRLERVAERLRQIEQEGRLPEYDVTIRPVSALRVASMRTLVPEVDGLPEMRHLTQGVIGEWVAHAGLRSSGSWIMLYHNPTYTERNLDVELALPVGEGGKPSTGKRSRFVALRELPPVPSMACLLYPAQGSASQAYTSLYAWAERGGYQVIGPARETWLDEANAARHPDESTTPLGSPNLLAELQLPVLSPQERKQQFFISTSRKESDMEPKFVELPAFQVAGMRYFGNNQNQEIKDLWSVANKRFDELQHVDTDGAYGVCLSVPGAANGEFEYVCSLKVSSAADLPEGMVAREVPAGRYAVFTHVGALDMLHKTYEYIYQTWFPQSGCQIRGDLDFEFYNDDFKDFAPDSRFYIYVPVK